LKKIGYRITYRRNRGCAFRDQVLFYAKLCGERIDAYETLVAYFIREAACVLQKASDIFWLSKNKKLII
jgi:hypothetical protein